MHLAERIVRWVPSIVSRYICAYMEIIRRETDALFCICVNLLESVFVAPGGTFLLLSSPLTSAQSTALQTRGSVSGRRRCDAFSDRTDNSTTLTRLTFRLL